MYGALLKQKKEKNWNNDSHCWSHTGWVFTIALISCDEPHSGISLSQEGAYIFPSATVGYGEQTPLTVTVKNHSSYSFYERVVLSGPNTNAFTGNFNNLGFSFHFNVVVHMALLSHSTSVLLLNKTIGIRITVTKLFEYGKGS